MLQTPVHAPQRLGAYKFLGTVGEGAFSIVKLVVNEETQQFNACKIVPKERLSTMNLEQRFEAEIRINQQLHHPGIVQIVDLLKDENNFYIFMEFCPNGELFQYIVDRNRLSEKEAALMVKQIFQSLDYVHSIGVAHRDLKPENLLLDANGRVKISDFGLSRFVGARGLVETPCGSPCYASPECLSGKPYDGCKSDVWSCGVILYAMLTGQLPWTKRNQQQLFEQIKRGDYKIPNFLSPDGQDFVARLMEVNSDKRITIKEAFKHPWMQNVANEEPYEDSTLTIISLRRVDGFFGNDNEENELTIRSDDKFGKSESARLIQFAQLAKALADKNQKLPPIRNSRKTDTKAKPERCSISKIGGQLKKNPVARPVVMRSQIMPRSAYNRAPK